MSRHRHVSSVYRVNVRSNALLNNVRPCTREERSPLDQRVRESERESLVVRSKRTVFTVSIATDLPGEPLLAEFGRHRAAVLIDFHATTVSSIRRSRDPTDRHTGCLESSDTNTNCAWPAICNGLDCAKLFAYLEEFLIVRYSLIGDFRF